MPRYVACMSVIAWPPTFNLNSGKGLHALTANSSREYAAGITHALRVDVATPANEEAQEGHQGQKGQRKRGAGLHRCTSV